MFIILKMLPDWAAAPSRVSQFFVMAGASLEQVFEHTVCPIQKSYLLYVMALPLGDNTLVF